MSENIHAELTQPRGVGCSDPWRCRGGVPQLHRAVMFVCSSSSSQRGPRTTVPLASPAQQQQCSHNGRCDPTGQRQLLRSASTGRSECPETGVIRCAATLLRPPRPLPFLEARASTGCSENGTDAAPSQPAIDRSTAPSSSEQRVHTDATTRHGGRSFAAARGTIRSSRPSSLSRTSLLWRDRGIDALRQMQ